MSIMDNSGSRSEPSARDNPPVLIPDSSASPSSETQRGESQVLTATSQGFYPPPPEVLKRSLIISSVASAFGAMFFSVVQGAIFNFFLEDLSLRDRLPHFMGLWCIAGLGTLVGSWIQARWNCRKGLFLWCVGGSRLIWLIIGLIPIFWPELAKSEPAFMWLSVLTLAFYFIHALGSNAWLSWMADLVPAHLQGRYWSLRQVGCSGAGAAARLLTGYYLDAHHNFTGYAILFGAATIVGVIDALLFLFVEHRRPKKRAVPLNVASEFLRRIKEEPFRRLCMVYLLWGISNCINGPTFFFLMRDQVHMNVSGIALVDTLSLVAFTAFSLIWGKFSDRHGQRGSLILCLLMHAFSPALAFFAGKGGEWLIALSMVIGSIGFCGINLFMFPMLINFTKGKGGGREVGLATFMVVLSLSNYVAFFITDHFLFESLGHYLGEDSHSPPVYLVALSIGMFFRFCSVAICFLLPKETHETPPGVLVQEVVTTSPLRAAVGFYRYVTGREELEEAEAEKEEKAVAK